MLKALRDNIFVELIEEKKKLSSILITLDDPEHVLGKVVVCGPGIHDQRGNFIDMIVEPGDTIVFSKNALNTKINYDGVDYYVMQPEHIYGTVNDV